MFLGLQARQSLEKLLSNVKGDSIALENRLQVNLIENYRKSQYNGISYYQQCLSLLFVHLFFIIIIYFFLREQIPNVHLNYQSL